MSRWVLEKITDHSDVLGATLVEPSVIQFEAKTVSGKIGCLTGATVQRSEVITAIDAWGCDYIVRVKTASVVKGEALDYCRMKNVGIGSLGCLYRAINSGDMSDDHDNEATFILRGLGQHTKVISVNRLTNRLYEIQRRGLTPLRVLAINDYDITADSVRSHVAGHGRCDLILSSNPNARGSIEADRAAVELATEVVSWADLLGKINYFGQKK